jgi:hypothetical protein
MLDDSTRYMFNVMMPQNAGGGNYTGLPFIEVDGRLEPCWTLPAPFAQEPWCGPVADLRMLCFARGDCNTTADGSSFGFYCKFFSPGSELPYSNPPNSESRAPRLTPSGNYTLESTRAWRVADAVAFVAAGGDGVDGARTLTRARLECHTPHALPPPSFPAPAALHGRNGNVSG